ncbi:MAG: TolC family protein [Myxococcota bacterium]
MADDITVRVVGDVDTIPPFSVDGIEARLQALFRDRSVDVVLALGPVAATRVGQRTAVPKPVVAPIVLDAEFQGLPAQEGRSGLVNFNFIQTPTTLQSGLAGYARVIGLPRVLILLDPRSAAAAAPDGRGEAALRAAAEDLGLKPTIRVVAGTPEITLSEIPTGVEGVLLSALPSYADAEVEKLVSGLNDRGLPSFSPYGRSYIEAGVTAGYEQDLNPRRLARQTALHIALIAEGAQADALPISLPSRIVEPVLNMATAKKVNFRPRWELIVEAELVGVDRMRPRRTETLGSAMKRAIDSNLLLATARQAVAVGEAEVQRTASPLLPQVDVGLSGTVIDADRARVGFGANPEVAGIVSVDVRQSIYDEPLWANRSIQKRLQSGVEAARREVELDIGELAALTFLDVLRTQAELEVQRRNLGLTRSNLDLASLRNRVGVGEPAEVPRWENQLAVDQQGLVQGVAVVRQFEVALNRVLNLPLDQGVQAEEASLGDEMMSDFSRLFDLLDRPVGQEALNAFLVKEALRNAPEIDGLDAQITAQDRLLVARDRAFWLPSFGAFFNLDYRFAEAGDGVGGIDFTVLPPEFQEGLPEAPDELFFTVGAFLSYPLFAGLDRVYARNVDRAELTRLRLERAEQAQRIETRVRTELYRSGASYPSIALARKAAAAARESLRITTEAYASGTLPLVRLLDAQTASFAAEIEAARAVYVFLQDFVRVQRAAGDLDVFLDGDVRKDFLEAFESEVLDAESK